jgi:crotonobetainyl-CoA:carnitine CoA-transferase CaiB-like acyl-CoA transferase
MEMPLAKIRVLDLTQVQAGTYGSMILGDLGAEVIKIEPPQGDFTREFPFYGHRGESYYYLAFNRNKKGMVLDLKTNKGREIFYQLVKIADVVLDNFSPGVVEKLGVDYDTVSEINPQIISCSITGFGSTGPYRERRSFDLIAQAMSGAMSVTGEPGKPPVRCGISIADMAGGMYAALGILVAHIARQQSGRGQKVDISLLDGMMALLSYFASYHLLSGEVPGPQGSGHFSVIPYGAFRTKDGYIAIAEGWPRMARVLGIEQYVDDPRFTTRVERLKHREELGEILQEALLREETDIWVELLNAEGIAAAPVNTLDKALSDPQVVYRDMVINIEHALGGVVKLVGNPIKMSGASHKAKEILRSPPTLGQHTEEILTELLGYSKDEIEELRTEGVISPQH